MDTKLKKILSGIGVLAAFGLGGAAIAGAQGEKPAGGSANATATASEPGEAQEGQEPGEANEREQRVTGADAERAGQAALSSVGGGKVIAVEKETPEKGADKPEPGEQESAQERAIDQKAAYSVEVQKTDGTTVDVVLDDGFNVLASEADNENEAGEAGGQK